VKRYVFNVLIGSGVGVASGLVYFLLLHEPGSLFYPFSAIAFIGGPCLAGLLAALNVPGRRVGAFLTTSSSVFAVVFIFFLSTYMIWPQFERTSMKLPASCSSFHGSPHPPAALTYVLSDHRGTGILVAEGEGVAVVAVISDAPLHPSGVYVVDTSAKRVLNALSFPNDVIMAAVDDGIVHIYNDKIGYSIDARTGEFTKNILLTDNYGGLSQRDRPILADMSGGNAWYVETSAIISLWDIDGSVYSRRQMFFNAIARGCFVNGRSGEVTKL